MANVKTTKRTKLAKTVIVIKKGKKARKNTNIKMMKK